MSDNAFKSGDFPVISMAFDSSGSADKDTLIDEMQTKVGELLLVNQELCSARNEIETLKSRLEAQKREFQRERDGYEENIARLEAENAIRDHSAGEQSQTMQACVEDRRRLENLVAELRRQVAQLERDSDEAVEHQVGRETGKLRATVVGKTREIDTLRNQLEEAVREQDSSSDSATQCRVENERLQARVEKQEAELAENRRETAKLVAKVAQEKERAMKRDEENKELTVQINGLASELRHEKEMRDASMSKVTAGEVEVRRVTTDLQKALSIHPGFANVGALAKYVQKREKMIEQLTHEIKKEHSAAKKMEKELVRCKESLKVTEGSVANSVAKISALHDQNVNQSVEIANLKRTNQHQHRRLEAIPSLEKANILLNQRLTNISYAVREEEDVMSVRTLILMSIMLMRWRGLPSTPRAYTTDSRNWWWMTAEKRNRITAEEVSERLRRLNEENTTAKSRIQKLHRVLGETREQLKTVTGENAAMKKSCEAAVEQSVQTQERMKALEGRFGERVDPEEHQLVLSAMTEAKRKYKQAKGTARENTMEITNLQIALSQTKQKLSHQLAVTQQKDRCLEDAQIEIYRLHDGMSHLRQGNSTKSREILALERNTSLQQQKSRSITAQNDVVALENRRMGVQMATYRKRIEAAEKL